MGNAPSSLASSPGAQFVSDAARPVFQSFPPCHLYGDASTLYSAGTRAGYYLHYLAAVLSIIFLGGGRDLSGAGWYFSFVALAGASLIGLAIDAGNGEAVVVLDWAIVFGLVFWSVVVFARSVFCPPPSTRRGQGRDARQMQADLARERGGMVGEREAEWHWRYVAVLKDLHVGNGELESAVEDSEEQERDGDAALERALWQYVDAFAAARGDPSAIEAAGFILALYQGGDRDHIHETAVRMAIDNKQLELFRDAHAEALRQANIPFDQAQATTQALARFAVQDLSPKGQARSSGSPWQVMGNFQASAGASGVIGCGLGFILYAGYAAFTVWLLFRGVDHGKKSGCDVRIILIFVPVSIYSQGVVTALRVLASIWLALVGVPVFIVGWVMLAYGARNWWSETNHHGRRNPDDGPAGKRILEFKAMPYDSEKAKGKAADPSVTSLPRPAYVANPTWASRASDLFYDAAEFPQPTGSAVPEPRRAGYFDPSVEKGPGESSGLGIRGGQAVRAGLAGSVWATVMPNLDYLFFLAIGHTIAVVEVTIRINKLDMRQRSMTSMGELLAFLLGAFVLLRVLARCLLAGARRLRRQQSARWHEERWSILSIPPSRWQERYGALGRVPTQTRESFRRMYRQSEAKSVSSMGRFTEMIDDDGG
ncbi:hypothetical protein B0T22DRAFT_115862 [Podospora appendiculata]|uniref:Uncharacterized protein n=1 Tax=Podospora appendiculata TaxID=314037 RepID=A0AAE0XM00_9PEZI|nr:hypothetical protein B0T22DRAFT_115862 [Podospora appendiculata]